MKLWIICCGQPDMTWPQRCDAAGYDLACRRAAECAPLSPALRPMAAADRRVYVAPGRLAAESALLSLGETATAVEPLLSALPEAGAAPGGAARPLWLQRYLSRRRDWALLRRRAEELTARLERDGGDFALVCPAPMAAALLEALRRRGFCANRQGVGSLKPLERILVTRRDEHCGGCGHNCLLSNPGCGVGRDKAARRRGA